MLFKKKEERSEKTSLIFITFFVEKKVQQTIIKFLYLNIKMQKPRLLSFALVASVLFIIGSCAASESTTTIKPIPDVEATTIAEGVKVEKVGFFMW